MAKQRKPFALGLAVIVMFALFFGVLIAIAKVDFKKKDVFVVRFTEQGALPQLKAGGLVKCGPQMVGKILAVEIREETDKNVSPPAKRLYFFVTANADSRIGLREDCTVVPEGPLLGGAGMLAIKDRGISANRVSKDKVIIGEQGGGFFAITDALAQQLDEDEPDSLLALIKTQLDPQDATSLLAKLHKSMDDLNAVTASVSAQLDAKERSNLLAKFHSILDNVNAATGFLKAQLDAEQDAAMLAKLHVSLDTLNSGLRTVVDMLEENREPVTETVASIRNTARTLETRIAEQIAQQLDTSNAASLLAKIHVGVDRLNQSLEDINAITETGREVVVLNQGKLNAMVANFKATSDHLNGAAKDIRRNPWRLLYRPTLAETKQLDIFDAARAFSEAATELDDAVIQLNALAESEGGTVPSDDPQLVEIRERLAGTFEKFTQAEAALWKQLNVGK